MAAFSPSFRCRRAGWPGRPIVTLLVGLVTAVLALAQAPEKPPRRVALLVGVNVYQKRNFPDLHWAENDVNEVQPVSATGSLIALKAGGGSRPVPLARKPFRYVWMTHDLPSDWAPLSPLSDWSVLPKSFVSAQFQPRGAPRAAFAGDSNNRDTSTLFCVIRC